MRKENAFSKFVKKNYEAFLFVLPLIIGIAMFTLQPVLSSLYYSFFDYDMVNAPENFGLQNYISIFAGAESALFWKSVKNTLSYVLISMPISMVLSYLLALALKETTASNQVFRVLYYIPVLIPSVVTGLVWMQILDLRTGIINVILRDYLALPTFDFMNRDTLMGTFIGMHMFTIGGGMIIWISAFNAIPETLYEAARIDGAGKFRCFLQITVPLSTPSIFYNLVTGIIGGFQVFGSAYVLTGGTGGDGDALLFVVMRIYKKAFMEWNFGMSSAMSWVVFAIIAVLTVISFKTKKWVYYGDEE